MKVEYFYDISCPFAYQALHLLERSAVIRPRDVVFKPFLLGAVFGAVNTPRDKNQVASDLMSPARKHVHQTDLLRSMNRAGIKLRWPDHHPQRTVSALRSLLMVDEEERRLLTHVYFDAYWQENRDLADETVLQELFEKTLNRSWAPISDEAKTALRHNTQQVIDAGGFGAPTFIVNGKLFFGADRLHLVESECGVRAEQLRLAPTWDGQKRKLTFYFDVASPFSYLAATQIRRIAQEAHAELALVPILLGALFNSIGSPNIPLFSFSAAKRAYWLKDLEDWRRWLNLPEPLRFPDVFPIRSITAQRVLIVEPSTMDAIFEAAWIQNENLSDDAVLAKILDANGFDGKELVKSAQTQAVKDHLRANTDNAIASGVCGAPSYQVNDGEVIFGQDRLNVVQDLLNGWF